MSLMAVSLLRLGDQVHDGEDHDPDDVDEVPVEAGDLDLLGVALVESTLGGEAPEGDQPDDADRDVGAVEAGEDEERRAEQVGVEGEALAGKLGELEDLAADEHRAEQRGGEQPDAEPSEL